MNVLCTFAVVGTASPPKWQLAYIWGEASPEAKVIIFILLVFSITAWTVMITKAIQMARAKKLSGELPRG